MLSRPNSNLGVDYAMPPGFCTDDVGTAHSSADNRSATLYDAGPYAGSNPNRHASAGSAYDRSGAGPLWVDVHLLEPDLRHPAAADHRDPTWCVDAAGVNRAEPDAGATATAL